MKRIYLDNSATTAVDNEVVNAMLPYFSGIYGNPSSLHSFGREALLAVDAARDKIAELLGAKPREIFFTSGGSESDNWAIKGVAHTGSGKKHIITTVIEHPAVLETCRKLEKEGVEVSYVKVNSEGLVSLDDIKAAVRDDTVLVSVMFANNEVGSIQPIAEIGAFCHDEGILFHTDAVQAFDSQNIDVDKLHIDMLSLSAHKFHGPKGIGLLYVRSGINLPRMIDGGEQEKGKRAGTTDTPLIVGMAKAMEITAAKRAENAQKEATLRDYFIDRVQAEIPYVHLNGGRKERLPNNANFSFDFIEGESILINLDIAGIAVSSGSACSSGSLEPSHVIMALGVPPELAHSSTRFSLGRDTTKEDLDYTVDVLKATVERLRAMSPLFNMEKGTGSYV